MRLSRRNALTGLGAMTLLSGCRREALFAAGEDGNKRLMINGNMVIPFDSDGKLPPSYSEKIRSTGLAAVKVSLGGPDANYEQAREMVRVYDQGILDNPECYRDVRSVSDILAAYRDGRVGIIKSFEASSPIEDDLNHIFEFAGLGVKVMQLSYNKASSLGAGVMSQDGELGLTAKGRDAVARMNASGVLLDLSHSHEVTAIQALTASTRPAAVTHGGCGGVFRHPRHKSDEFMKALADAGGVFGIYELSYLTRSQEPTPMSAFIRHIRHALNVCGEDHVGIGSDTLLLAFDTSPEGVAQWDAITKARKEAGIAAPGEGPLPFVTGLNGPHRMNTIAQHLEDEGLSPRLVDKVMGKNFLRLFQEVWV